MVPPTLYHQHKTDAKTTRLAGSSLNNKSVIINTLAPPRSFLAGFGLALLKHYVVQQLPLVTLFPDSPEWCLGCELGLIFN